MAETSDGASRPIRVRHLLKGLGPGGAERLVVHQTTSPSTRCRHEVAYLLAHKNHLVAELEAAGVPVRCLPTRGLWRPGWLLALRRWALSDPVDVLHVHSPAVAAATRVLVRTLPRSRRPAVVGTEHNRWPRLHRLTRLADRLTLGAQDATIAVSADVAATLPRRARAEVVVHGIDVGAVRAAADREGARRELGISPDDVVVVCVANFRREKALDVLVAAAARAIEREPRLSIVHVGQGPLADEIAAGVERAGLGDRFRLLGHRRDVARLLSAADVVTLTSRHEGLPVAVMEALAAGRPVVATRAGGVAEAVGDAGILVDVDDVAGLADAYVTLARDETRRRTLGERAARRAHLFDRERAVARLDEIYAAVVAARRGAEASRRS
ncbi:MAG: glycosyltransferase [Actinomyces sp.]|nr:MAG: glycosyltransferase [Actinomyces sp.]